MVWFEGRLVVYGGYMGQNQFSGELHIFDLDKGKRKGSWVVDRVVGSAQLYQGDNSSLHDGLTKALTPPPLSDEKALEVIRRGLENSRVSTRNLLGVLVGIVGSGKTCFLSRLVNQPLP
ncbi:hypothetical protein GBAR_LOCUS7344 [Geodia barretti]|uniref:Uncharacterized protein n=1 Tax=Geodia barretti TaxID=519541 RepID=A0AA35RH39_GEOBA|nr:hypothetical protein GBAR_LOCUS7344 [Geodia barretti]